VRSSSSTSSAAVWITTSHRDRFFVVHQPGWGTVGNQAMPSACMSTRHQKGHTVPRAILCGGLEGLHQADEIGLGAAMDAIAMIEKRHVAFGRAPAISSRQSFSASQLWAEPFGEAEGFAIASSISFLVAHLCQIDARTGSRRLRRRQSALQIAVRQDDGLPPFRIGKTGHGSGRRRSSF